LPLACDIQNSLFFHHQRPELLLLIGDPWWEWREVPVNMGVALVAAEAEDVEPLTRDCLRYRAAESMNNRLKTQVLRFGEVGDAA
jgi:hypothetical protein